MLRALGVRLAQILHHVRAIASKLSGDTTNCPPCVLDTPVTDAWSA